MTDQKHVFFAIIMRLWSACDIWRYRNVLVIDWLIDWLALEVFFYENALYKSTFDILTLID